jgi:hypothetical protein
MIRGISNTTGTACHLSSALVIICHCLVPLRKALVHYSNTSAATPWFQQLGAFLDQLASTNRNELDNVTPIDPTRFFQALKKEIGIEAHELGDAVTALVKILQNVRRGIPSLEPLFQATVDAGRVHSVMTGTARWLQRSDNHNDDDSDSDIWKRSKETKSRPMSCPFSLPGDCESIEIALQATLAPQPLQGYQWTAGSFKETRVPVTECIDLVDDHNQDDDWWNNTKTLQLDAVPNMWMMHLNRFHVQRDSGQRVAMEPYTRVSKSLELEGIGNLDPHKFECLGGILHVTGEEEDEDEEEGGHYVAIVRQEGTGCWYLVDDGHTDKLTEYTALQMLSGHENIVTSRGSYMRGILLVYAQKNVTDEGGDTCTSTTADKLLADFVDELAKSYIDWSRPHDVVGRHLRIKWAKGKFYPGTVASYNEDTGKHQVRYADGDVKEYTLRQKTIEWQEDDA